MQNVFFCKELLKERFFYISEDYESSFYRSPNALRETYQVVLEEDIMNYIKNLDKHIYECILFNFLYKIKDELETLSFDEFNKILTEEEIKKEFKNFGVSFDKDDFNEDDFVDKKAEFMQIYRILRRYERYTRRLRKTEHKSLRLRIHNSIGDNRL